MVQRLTRYGIVNKNARKWSDEKLRELKKIASQTRSRKFHHHFLRGMLYWKYEYIQTRYWEIKRRRISLLLFQFIPFKYSIRRDKKCTYERARSEKKSLFVCLAGEENICQNTHVRTVKKNVYTLWKSGSNDTVNNDLFLITDHE